jgi:hypothetical protein
LYSNSNEETIFIQTENSLIVISEINFIKNSSILQKNTDENFVFAAQAVSFHSMVAAAKAFPFTFLPFGGGGFPKPYLPSPGDLPKP